MKFYGLVVEEGGEGWENVSMVKAFQKDENCEFQLLSFSFNFYITESTTVYYTAHNLPHITILHITINMLCTGKIGLRKQCRPRSDCSW